ncbi:MAG: ribonuclease H [Candidatus Kapaibacterium sp.]
MKNELNIYTDGSCLNNPGKGGWGIVVIKPNGSIEEYSQGYKLTTNSRMEMMAMYMALKYAEKHGKGKVIIHSDSNFIIQAFTQNWLEGWVKKGWKKQKNEPVANADIWKKIYPLYKKLEVNLNKVKAHSGIEHNEQVDELARAAAMSNELIDDIGYIPNGEQEQTSIFEQKQENKITLENVLSNGVPSVKIKSGTKTITITKQQLEDFLK